MTVGLGSTASYPKAFFEVGGLFIEVKAHGQTSKALSTHTVTGRQPEKEIQRDWSIHTDWGGGGGGAGEHLTYMLYTYFPAHIRQNKIQARDILLQNEGMGL